MTCNYPILLNEIRFGGTGFDKGSFDGVVLYARQLPMSDDAKLVGKGYEDELDEMIKDYVKSNLPGGCSDITINLISHLINSESELLSLLKQYGEEFNYDKQTFEFMAYPGIDIIESLKGKCPNEVLVKDLTACTRGVSEDMCDALYSAFRNMHHPYTSDEPWSKKQSILSQKASSIVGVYNYMFIKITLLLIENHKQTGENLLKAQEYEPHIYDVPIITEDRIDGLIMQYKSWYKKYYKYIREARFADVAKDLPIIDERNEEIRILTSGDNDAKYRAITSFLKKHITELKELIESVHVYLHKRTK